MAHTPGPWRALERGRGDNAIRAARRLVCTVTFNGALDGATMQADAALIAAAPDLLEALRQCEDLLAELADGGAENPELEIARAAIAKAEGK